MDQEKNEPCSICWKHGHKTDECQYLKAAGQNLADSIDKDIMDEIILAGKLLDNTECPTEGRRIFDPESGELIGND